MKRRPPAVTVTFPAELTYSALVTGRGAGQLLVTMAVPFQRHGDGFVIPRGRGVDVADAALRRGGDAEIAMPDSTLFDGAA